MQVDDALIEKLSRLSMIRVSEEEREGLKKDLREMIGFFDKLKELDVSGTEPLLHMTTAAASLRPDIPGDMVSREAALQNAPQHNGTFFQVPKVIKKGV